MEFPHRLVRGDALIGREQEFYWLWIGATAAYGVGDIVTTLTILMFDVGVRETNLLMKQAFESLGHTGIILLKLFVFFTCLSISLYAAEKLDWPLYYAPPVILAAFGGLVTTHNLGLMAGIVILPITVTI